ncbi:MAG: SUMF1/EgtB/PvdO family nonheme iron enzyme [Planctomycetota bacterium]
MGGVRPISPRVLRGGSWNNNPRNCRSANRNRNTPDNRNNNIGFRLVVAAPPGARAFLAHCPESSCPRT